MKKYFLLILAFLVFHLFAQGKDLSGNWREITRTTKDGKSLSFKDTMLVAFLEGNEYTLQKKRGFIYRGTYKIKNNLLDMGSRVFTIEKQSGGKLVLSDQSAVYEFEPYTPTINQLPAEKAPVAINDITEIRGKWEVFKRTSETTMKDIDYTKLVQTVMIYDVPEPDGAIGYITASRAPQKEDGWKITDISNNALQCSGKTQRSFLVSKRDNELILKEGNITYFLKRFKE